MSVLDLKLEFNLKDYKKVHGMSFYNFTEKETLTLKDYLHHLNICDIFREFK